MLFTPRTKRQETQTTQYSSNLSRLSKRNTTEIESDSFVNSNPAETVNEEIEKLKPIAKLSIQIRKQKVKSPSKIDESPKLRVNPNKYRANIVSKMSSQQHGNIIAYGISTLKGAKNVVNPHFLSINLGRLNSITLSQSFDGQSAAKMVKEEFRNQLTILNEDKSYSLQMMIKEAFNRVQEKVMAHQLEARDNSGATLLSVVLGQQLAMVGNAGSSQVFCETNGGSFLKLSESHNTYNEKETKRIVKNGGTLYQTVVNVPYQLDLQIQGPMRISPSGLTFTRCLGKTLDLRKQINSLSQTKLNPQEHLNITWKPQIRYIKTKEVLWLGIFSEAIMNNCSHEFIKECVRMESKKKSQEYTEHHIAMEISRKIVDKLASQGVAEAMSVIIIFLTPLPPFSKQPVFKNDLKNKKVILENKKEAPQQGYSLKYLGNRRSFVKSVESSSRTSSLQKSSMPSIEKRKKELKNDFSFSNFN